MDPILLLKHLRLETTPYSCTREQFSTTGVPFLPTPGDFRRMFNGEVEYVESIMFNEYKTLVKDWMTNNYDKQR